VKPKAAQGRARKFGAIQEYIETSWTFSPVRGAWMIIPFPTYSATW
jgi:hypothetical protein